MALIDRKERMDYWNVSHGALRKKCSEDDPQAEKREYTTKTGEKKVIYEIVKEGVSGYIRNVELRDGDYGEQLMVYIDDVDSFALQMSWDSSEALSFAEKLKGIDLAKEVELKPYHFTPKGKSKAIRGMSVYQDGKLGNYFIETDADGNKVGYKEGFPEAEGDVTAYDKEDWRILFMKQKKYLRKYVIDMFPFVEGGDSSPKEEPKKDDLPW